MYYCGVGDNALQTSTLKKLLLSNINKSPSVNFTTVKTRNAEQPVIPS